MKVCTCWLITLIIIELYCCIVFLSFILDTGEKIEGTNYFESGDITARYIFEKFFSSALETECL